MKNRQTATLIILLIALALSMLALAGCSDREQKNEAPEGVSSYAQALFDARVEYLGDNSADSALLRVMGVTEALGDFTLELETEVEPYILRLLFATEVNDGNAFNQKMNDYAALLLALIDNCSEVQWQYVYSENGPDADGAADGTGVFTGALSLGDATARFNVADLKSYGASAAAVQELLDLLGEQTPDARLDLSGAATGYPDGTLEAMACAEINNAIASYVNQGYTVADAELVRIIPVAGVGLQSDQPLYYYLVDFRIKLAEGEEYPAVGSINIADGWLVDAPEKHGLLLAGDREANHYTYLGKPAFDLPLNQALRELLLPNAELAREFTFYADFQFSLGRQFGSYPWNDYDSEVPQPYIIDNTDSAGADFYALELGSYMDSGENYLTYYIVAESGLNYINYMRTNDPYTATARGVHTGQSVTELLAAYPEATVNANFVYGETDPYPYDTVYQYASGVLVPEETIYFYILDGKISGIAMSLFLA